MKKILVGILAAILVVSLAGVGFAKAKPKAVTLKGKPFIVDPADTGTVSAAWVTHKGLPDAGKSAHALYLAKEGSPDDMTYAGVVVLGVQGQKLTKLGVDLPTKVIGDTAPRFVVTTADGAYSFPCNTTNGTQTPIAGTDWTNVVFGDADAVPGPNTTVAWPGFIVDTAPVVTGIYIVYEAGSLNPDGSVLVDNINVNDIVIGKPGNARAPK